MAFGTQLAALPSVLRRDPRCVAAMARRDIGALFALAHHEAGISYNRIGEACGIRAERVSQIARGNGEVSSLPVLERIADGLGIPGADLGLASRPWEAGVPTTPPIDRGDGDDPMKRRDVMRGALAAGLAGTGLAAVTSTRTDIDAALAADHTQPDLDHWQSTAERYGYGYHGRAPSDVLSSLLEDVEEMKPLLFRAQSDRSRTQLCHVTGQMAGMVAIVLHDLGEHREAHRWFATAGRAAKQSGDQLLHAWVLGREAMVPLNYGAPAAAAKLADQARHLAGNGPSSAAALAAAVASRAYAMDGYRDKALAAVSDVERLADLLTPQQRADTWFGYPVQKHHVHMSQALTHLGETARAYETQAAALELSRAPSLMTRALIAIDEACCRLHDGDRAQAAHITAQAYGSLPASYRNGLTRIRALAVFQRLPADTIHLDDLADLLGVAA
ncbi:helix-turn-helix domain-containing protein [Streptomyces sp. NPDC058653]|uniref:helix-turn-helix domain-containing protein n=1 Tax=Streptomyces sp. NPDC058653 TaxID=3346576 RepID=UPI00365F284B